MLSIFGVGKSNSVRDNHIKLLERWSDANPIKINKSQWSVKFKTRNATFVFIIVLPSEFPEVAPIFRFQSPVDHPWVDSHDGVTILNDSLLQWNPHCDITRIGKACVHEFVLNPPRTVSRRPGGGNPSAGSQGQLAIIYRKKPFGLRLRPRNKLQNQGAVIHSFEKFHEPNGLKAGSWLVTLGQRPVENMNFKQIIKLLGEVSVPIQLVFKGDSLPVEQKVAPQHVASHNYGMPVYQQPVRPAVSAYNQPVRPAPVSVGATTIPVQSQEPTKPKVAEKLAVAPPEIPDSTYDILDTYSINQLKDLLSDDLALEQVAMDVANKDLNRKRRKLREDTKAAANKNLSYKEKVETSRKELEELQKEVSQLQIANGNLFSEKQRLAPKIDRFQVKKAFAEAAERIDEESGEIFSKFEDDEIAYVTFIKKYKALRESHHEYMMK